MPRFPRTSPSLAEIGGSVFSSLAHRLAAHRGEVYPLHVGDTWLEPVEGCRMQDLTVETTELKGLIEQFMTQLSEHDRNLLLYRFAEGKGQEETAELLGSTRMKVRTAEAKLRNRLRAYLRHSGYIDNMPLGVKPEPQ